MRDAFTVKELIIVIIIIVPLAAVLVPVNVGANMSAIKTADASNLKQIMTMYIKHRTDTGQVWAYNKALVDPKNVHSGQTHFAGLKITDGAAFTLASFWELARIHDLSPDIYNSPAANPRILRVAGIDKTKDWNLVKDVEGDIMDWSGGGFSDYMLDWSAPESSGTIRPTLCNRDYMSLFGDAINVVFADSHLGANRDFEIDDDSVIHLSIEEGVPDCIFNAHGDEVETNSGAKLDNTMQLGRGHRKRAMMK